MKLNVEREKGRKKAIEYIQCDLHFFHGDVTPEMLETLKTASPEAVEVYNKGGDLLLSFHLENKYNPGGSLAKLAPFLKLAGGFSASFYTSTGQKPPMASLFEVIHLHIDKITKMF